MSCLPVIRDTIWHTIPLLSITNSGARTQLYHMIHVFYNTHRSRHKNPSAKMKKETKAKGKGTDEQATEEDFPAVLGTTDFWDLVNGDAAGTERQLNMRTVNDGKPLSSDGCENQWKAGGLMISMGRGDDIKSVMSLRSESDSSSRSRDDSGVSENRKMIPADDDDNDDDDALTPFEEKASTVLPSSYEDAQSQDDESPEQPAGPPRL